MSDAVVLTPVERAFLSRARRAVLATRRPDGMPRLVPVCFVLVEPGLDHVGAAGGVTLYSPLDEKPKRVADVHELARVRDILARPRVGLLVDRWDENWRALAWLRLEGQARVVEPGPPGSEHARAVESLRSKYPQYLDQDIGARPIIRVDVDRASSWGELG